MNRRAYLASAACSTGVLTGCLGLGTDTTNRLQVEDSNLSVTETACDGSESPEASVSVSNTGITVDGTFVATRECTDLALSMSVGVDPQTEGHIDIEVEEVQSGEGNCPSCIPDIDYSVSVETDNQPSQINVQHIPLEGEIIQPAVWTGEESGT